MKTIRTLMAIPFMFLGIAGLCAMIFEFGKGLVTMSLTDIVYGFALMVLTFIMVIIMGVLNPNRKNHKPSKKPGNPQPMTDKVRAVLIPADKDKPVTPINVSDLPTMQALVGGYIEAVGRGLDWVGYADEDGKIKNKPYNPRATHAMAFMSGHNPNDPIAGDVIVVGVDKGGVSANIPNVIAGRILEITGEIPA
jgi:hypothetical protein